MDLDEAKERSRTRYPDLYTAVTDGAVSFQHVLQVRRVRGRDLPLDRQIGRALEPEIRHRFEASHGKIVSDYWGKAIFGGCLLTDRDVVHMAMNVDLAEVVVLQTKLEQLCRDAQATFGSNVRLYPQRQETGRGLFSVASRLVATSEQLSAEAPQDPQKAATLANGQREAVKALNSEWALTRSRILVLIQRQARFDYFVGMLIGAPVTLLLFSLIGLLAASHWEEQIAVPAFMAATVTGTVGGVISVIQRMSSGQLRLDYTASTGQKRLLGAMRPLVAGTLAAIVQFGLVGGLLTVQGSNVTEATPAGFAFFALVGFAAGFSERFATDMIERAGQLITPPAPASQQSPAASLTSPDDDNPLSVPSPVSTVGS